MVTVMVTGPEMRTYFNTLLLMCHTQMCLKFLWEDEWDGSDPVLVTGGRPGGGGGGSASVTGAQGRGGGWNARGGQFVSATGAASDVCYHCQQPGHW